MPVLDGLGLLAGVTSDPSPASVRTVMLTTFELDEYVFEALELGASGFLLKDAAPRPIREAIRVVADGGSWPAPSVTRRVIEEFGTDVVPTGRVLASRIRPTASRRSSRGSRRAVRTPRQQPR
ncbi:hypothetical protein [Kineosporia mesophila]|nr:hypothetical protein [Kineosporia mesophila]